MPRRRKSPYRKLPVPRSHAPRSRAQGTLRLGLILGVLVVINLYVFLWRGGTSIPEVMEQASVAGGRGGDLSDDDLLLNETGGADPGAVDEQAEPEDRWVEGEVAPGDSLAVLFEREGIPGTEAERIFAALRPHMDLGAIRAGQTFRLEFTGNGAFKSFEFRHSLEHSVRVERGEGGTLSAAVVRAPTETRVIEIGGTIDSSLYATMREQDEDMSLVAFFVDVFAYDLNFYVDTHKGDSFRILVEKEYLGADFLRYGRILAAEYRGKAGTFRAFWWKEPGGAEGNYYDEKGNSLERTFLKTPLKYARVSSKFNPRRMHPVLHVTRGHWGVDYAAPTGTPIWAAAAGKIVFRGRRGGAGNCIIVQHDNGLQTVYMHLSKFRKGHQVGSRVRAKDVIGYVGASGLATGPHLHFGVKQNGRYIDPLKLKMTRGRSVVARHMPAFRREAAQLEVRLAQVSVVPGQRPSVVSGRAGGSVGAGVSAPLPP
jgi:murein DD-endopeptidase MepM/ murein hydrolase activator NlpD